ncbi:hypothetical protein OEB99_16570 [Actinotalea sp. M2MS4P-6]|uniref:hypothetical protein n=1 Tax=Actinotalea sp. M2MS4P-6 TaxID=2983762 RepID=UPI0021E4EE85|nr:hypothetical protein [Actinotalea sp. M2MS4P-6]MCV2395931.1 hypothetical protein [Actinotalea sp. M2MS4P-6]
MSEQPRACPECGGPVEVVSLRVARQYEDGRTERWVEDVDTCHNPACPRNDGAEPVTADPDLDLPDPDAEPLHMWRLKVLGMGPGGVSQYWCELCGELLYCPPADEPEEC